MRIVVLGAGVQGTLYSVRLARSGHDVTLVARGARAAELREGGAAIRDAITNRSDVLHLPVIDQLTDEMVADICLVTVRREQLDDALPQLVAATGIARRIVMVNHANGSEALCAALGRERVILGFPGAAGGMQDGVDRYVEVAEQRSAIEARAPDVASLFRGAGFRVELVRDMDSWLRRHAVFVTAIAGALCAVDGDASRLASDSRLIRYWRTLLRSPRGELYFALHTRHAPQKMAALVADILPLIDEHAATNLTFLYGAIERAAAAQAPIQTSYPPG